MGGVWSAGWIFDPADQTPPIQSDKYQYCMDTVILDDMIYLLTAIGYPHGGSSTVHIYTQTIHRRTQNKRYIEQHKN